MQNLESIDELGVTLQVVNPWKHLLIEPILDLEITRESRYNEIFELFF